MTHTTWLAQRALLALALMIGFYLLAAAVASALLWIPYAEWTYLHRVDGRIALFCIGTAFAVLWAVIPRPDRFVPPGPQLDERSHPRLFTLIREVAAATHQQMPSEVYLVSDVNAWVAQRGGVMGCGSRRVMGLGLPLLQGLTVSELKAVLAHEFGHYAAGDVKLGPWIYKTRGAIGRTLQELSESSLSVVFKVYGNMFLRLTHGISREQEFKADAVAARVVHPTVTASALQRVECLGPAFMSYWQSEVAPALNAGVLPPLAQGFDRFLQSEQIVAALTRITDKAAAEGQSSAFDTHPPLRERLAALALVQVDCAPAADASPATTLVGSADDEAARLLEFAAGADACGKLRRVAWDTVAGEVYPVRWRKAAEHFAGLLSRFTVDALPAGRAAFVDVGRELVKPGEGGDDLRVSRACEVLAIGVAVTLLDAGATLETGPGQPLTFRIGEASINPFATIHRLSTGEESLESWQHVCALHGIAGRQLAIAPPEPAPDSAAAAVKPTRSRRRSW